MEDEKFTINLETVSGKTLARIASAFSDWEVSWDDRGGIQFRPKDNAK